MAGQPFAKSLALRVGNVFEAEAGLTFAALPRQFALHIERFAPTRQFEREAEQALFGDAPRKLDGHAAFAEVCGRHSVAALAMALDRNLHRHTHLQSPFTLHQRAHGSKAGFGALHREWFVEHEM